MKQLKSTVLQSTPSNHAESAVCPSCPKTWSSSVFLPSGCVWQCSQSHSIALWAKCPFLCAVCRWRTCLKECCLGFLFWLGLVCLVFVWLFLFFLFVHPLFTFRILITSWIWITCQLCFAAVLRLPCHFPVVIVKNEELILTSILFVFGGSCALCKSSFPIPCTSRHLHCCASYIWVNSPVIIHFSLQSEEGANVWCFDSAKYTELFVKKVIFLNK